MLVHIYIYFYSYLFFVECIIIIIMFSGIWCTQDVLFIAIYYLIDHVT